MCFVNYDYKNQIETFDAKHNNSLQFPNQLFIKVEKEVALTDATFDKIPQNTPKISLQQTVSKKTYIEQVNRLKQHIQQGDIYEINYCIAFEAHGVNIDPLAMFQALNDISSAPYAALAKLNKQWILSSSPELFLSKRGNTLVTKPIKGTAKRSVNQIEDDVIKKQLQSNLKERTENVMIVDVCRNDLSRIASKGSVSVPFLFEIESYKQVHQMVSTVQCELKEHTSFNDILRSTFPMASMTGAPKIRAMQLIDEFELYNRNVYSGTLGYIKSNNDFDLSVLIRSIFYNEETKYLSFSVGSAITASCNAEAEYEECMLKAKAMMQVLSC
jgi:para-aminobenzoate synthetase component 1